MKITDSAKFGSSFVDLLQLREQSLWRSRIAGCFKCYDSYPAIFDLM